MLLFYFSVTFQCMHLWFSLMWKFHFSARTIRPILYIRGRECVRPRSTTTDHLSPTALVHTAPPRHSRPVTANRPPSPPTPPTSQPSPYALRLKNFERRHLRMYVRLIYDAIMLYWFSCRKLWRLFSLELNVSFSLVTFSHYCAINLFIIDKKYFLILIFIYTFSWQNYII